MCDATVYEERVASNVNPDLDPNESPILDKSMSKRSLKFLRSVQSANRDTALMYRRAVCGGILLKDILGRHTEWKAPSFELIVFLSSTFTDTHRERNYFMSKLLPHLVGKYRQYGIQVTFVDMRWGVRDENTLDHLTWIACYDELKRCKDNSMGVFFISLQSHKYGYCPLPKFIGRKAYEERFATLTPEQQSLANIWYSLDTNHLTDGGRYVLRNLKGGSTPEEKKQEDQEYWKGALPKLVKAFDGVIFDSVNGMELKVGYSVTSYEVAAAVASVPEEKHRLFWPNRMFAGGVNKAFYNHWDYDDTLDDDETGERKAKLSTMLNWMNGVAFDPSFIKRFDQATYDSFRNEDSIWRDQFGRFEADVSGVIGSQLEAIVDRKCQWDKDGEGLGLPGSLVNEILLHLGMLVTKITSFRGRQRLVDEAVGHIVADSKSATQSMIAQDATLDSNPGATAERHYVGSISLMVVGVSGSGKTALMSKLAMEIAARSSIPVIIRYCGTTAGSVTGLQLVLNICHQIQFIMGRPFDANAISGMPYKDLVSFFHTLLHEVPVILFIDSLDQLLDVDQARTLISFLRDCEPMPHPDTRIIVSMLPDDLEAKGKPHAAMEVYASSSSSSSATTETSEQLKVAKYYFGCESRLKGEGIPRVDVMLETGDAKDMIRDILEASGRRLTEPQRALVASALEVECTPLYLHLASTMVSTWTSTLPDDEAKLQGGVRNLINQIFESTERLFGEALVRCALALITFAVQGISDNEMIDLLTLDEEVMSSVNQYNQAKRLPPHVWYRLRNYLFACGLLAIQSDGCLVFYHRQLKETAMARYGVVKIAAHKLMAEYFGNIVDASKRIECQISSQPLVLNNSNSSNNNDHIRGSDESEVNTSSVWFENAVVNRRRCVEAAYHMVHARMTTQASQEICDIDSIIARAKCGLIFTTVRELIRVKDLYKGDAVGSQANDGNGEGGNQMVEHCLRWICRDVHRINRSPVHGISLSASEQPLVSQAKKLYEQRIKQLKKTKLSSANLFTVRTLGNWESFGHLLMNLEGHSSYVTSVAISPDGSTIVSGSCEY